MELAGQIIETFENKNATFFSQYEHFLMDMNDVLGFVSQTEKSWNHIIEIRDKAWNYLHNTSITKAEVAAGLTSKTMEENVRQLELFMSEARSRSHIIVDSLLRLRVIYKALWNNILSEPSTRVFYAKVHEDVMSAMHNESVMNELFSTFKYMTKESDLPFTDRSRAGDLLISMNADFPVTLYKNKSKAITLEFQVDKILYLNKSFLSYQAECISES